MTYSGDRLSLSGFAQTVTQLRQDKMPEKDLASLQQNECQDGEQRGESHAILRGEVIAIVDLAAGRRRPTKSEVMQTRLQVPDHGRLLSSNGHKLKYSRTPIFAQAQDYVFASMGPRQLL
jgi:hypothetical protein